MRIALVIEQMDTYRGGREASTAQMAVELARRGNEVTLLCQTGSLRDDAVKVVELGARGGTKLARLRGFVSDVQAQIAGGQFDIVHTTLPIPGANIYQLRGGTIPAQRAASLRRKSGAGRIVGAMWPLSGVRREMARLEREVMADPNVLCLAVSEMVADEIERYYERHEGICVVYNGVEVPDSDVRRRAQWRQEKRAEIGLDDDGVLFLTAAKNFGLKGVAETITAFAKWRNSGPDRSGKNPHLVLVGRDMVGKFRRLAQRLKVSGRVHFAGSVAPAEMPRWFAAADVCVLLSWYDPCSRVVLEAAHWGVPSITTAFNGASEAISTGAGVVVGSPSETDAVAAAMAKLADADTRLLCSQACLKLSESLSIERHIDELLKAYARCVGAGQQND